MVFLEDAEVLKNVRVADGIHELACRAPQIAGEGKPGQFVHMTVSPHRSTISSPLLRRPFSFYGVNAEAGTVSILYRI
ncbi:MAG: dihydroorotate dehydrogenase electron transfer subunit, partial [Bacillota bacterium]